MFLTYVQLVAVSCIEIIVQVKFCLQFYQTKHMMAPLSALCERSDYKLVRLNCRSYNGEIVQLQSALNDDYNNFSGKTKYVPHFRAHNWKIFPKPCVCTLYVHFGALSLIHSAPQQHFARFWRLFGQSCDRDDSCSFYLRVSLSFFSFLILQQLVIAF